ncbi:Gene 25-like lysozyme [Rosistilla oblonga]|uniref:Gene 25-like lysozyme n=1 Tax=Rosistilla oblonga TaxID=2527990 RepID=A0A518IRL0_9BACT|nr:type VI secretion system baseplate subunit TssE [Rosistilla oblonga]QDV11745.1 Gene 25-like lysozyme [Rosistilla oblonga]QDV55736.1 Gene 25-like lysozyme [Rosistilla oblonga]
MRSTLPTNKLSLLPSVFDRLADLSNDGFDSQPWYDVATLSNAVRRDLEDLLNTQQSLPELGRDFPLLAESVVGFGVPDPSTFALDTPSGRRCLAAALLNVINTFEPRLSDVRIELGNANGEKFRELKFRVVARLAIETSPQIVFESKLHVPSGQFSIGQDSE